MANYPIAQIKTVSRCGQIGGTFILKIMAEPWVMVGGRFHLNIKARFIGIISNSLMIQTLKIVGMTLSMPLSSLGVKKTLEDDLSKK